MTSVSGFFGRVLSRLSPQRAHNSTLGPGDQGAEVSGSSDSRSPSPSPRSTQPPNVNNMGDEPTPVVTRSRTKARNRDAQTQRASTDSTDLTLPNGPQAQDTVAPANTNTGNTANRNVRKSRTRRVRNIQTDTANDNSQQQNGSNVPLRLSTGSGNGNTSPLRLSTGSGNGNTSPFRLSSGSGNGNTSPFRYSTGSMNGNTSPLRLSTGSVNGNTSPLRRSAGSGNGNTSPFRFSTGSVNGNESPLSIGSGNGNSPPVNGTPQFLTVDGTRPAPTTGEQVSPSQDNGSSLSDSSSRSKLVEGDDKNASPPEERQGHDLEVGDPDENDNNNNPECAVCLLPCIHPVQLPCAHIFCYLCVKGVANQSKRCALCRQEIPTDFLNNPALLRLDSLVKEWQLQEGHQWYYEGRNGWWQYDERTSREMEEKYASDESAFELLIAGFLYVIDLKNMIQIRRNDPTRRRRIKRDSANIPDKKGVAGLKVSTASIRTPERRQGDGGEIASPAGATAATQTVVPSAPEADAMSVNSAKAALKEDSLTAPTNSPEHPESGSGKNDSRSESEEDLSNQMTTLRMARERHQMQIPRMRRRRRHRRRHHHHHGAHHFLDTPSTSSDSDYDY